jgi:phenylalanyl-tRNA synthetase beta subunit
MTPNRADCLSLIGLARELGGGVWETAEGSKFQVPSSFRFQAQRSA